MGSQLFRKNSLEKISSPEQINDYIKTSGISIWVVLSAIIIFTLGIIVWGITGHIETTQVAVTVCENNQAICYIAESDLQLITEDSVFKIDNQEYTADSISKLPVLASDVISPYAMHVADLEQDEWVYEAKLNSSIPDGIYQTQIVLSKVSPISLILN